MEAAVVAASVGLDPVGLPVGVLDGPCDGAVVGNRVGEPVGVTDGICDGLCVGDTDGLCVGLFDGLCDGVAVGSRVGASFGWKQNGKLCGLSVSIGSQQHPLSRHSASPMPA